MSKKMPLDGIIVADFTWVGAGPIATRFLSEYGAKVIKIETKSKPEILRMTGPFKDGIPGVDRSGYFSNRNPNKQSISLNMKHPKARDVAARIIEKSDLVINNFRPGVMEKWKLGYEDVKKIKPDIIFVTMSMQGSSGPHSSYMGFGATLNALVGFNHLSGFPDQPPFGTGTNYSDHVAVPTHTIFALMAAFRHRNKTGKGQFIEIPQSEAAICMKPVAVMDYAVNGREQSRIGNRHLNAAPHGVYRTSGDKRWIGIAVYNDSEWESLKNVMGNPAWANDPKFATKEGRMANQDQLDSMIEKWTSGQDGHELMQKLAGSGVRAGMVLNAKDMLEDPQMQARGHWVYLDHPEIGVSAYNGCPVHMSKTPAQYKTAAPLLGQHTEEVMKEFLNMDDREYKQLEADQVFA
ncbi:CaiB/BaiF CoA transferase family protein [Desulfoscipio gibsoniae]|uniref:Putative acyl-CoA transferase/carnitine dehydratase n=1 Tax=Desulfoscipio gibsoniae DSM 7213 TaxID=767817 RepID=R4KKN7_9FIRM|nr:CoA transferase [Desulfoscipio gibsoniae]AGL00201.1 putative acyl-CoA transferase/carnitine dehydratase [Desulfoscipio gibsoniae DSM 7213]AGL00224.1 putative acyl-CoA transferase/carnitine dehydratase [Desulfoscipio gibsoniae DSM 7213]